MIAAWRTALRILDLLPGGAKPFLLIYSITLGLLAVLDAAAVALLAVVIGPILSGGPVDLPVIGVVEEEGLVQPAVTLVDHGTPRIAVNKVRNHVAGQLAEVLKDCVSVVVASSMERREGDEYAFNEPLLENLLGQEKFEKDVVLSMLFISPGRHAGPPYSRKRLDGDGDLVGK